MIDFFSRLDSYMISRGLNDNKLTIDCHLANGIIGKARKRGALSQDNISKILNRYQELNANWLFTGDGEMLNVNESKKDTPLSDLHGGPCQQCELRDKIIAQQSETIELLKEKIESLKQSHNSSHNGNNGDYRQTA